jgi:hypothetical protein
MEDPAVEPGSAIEEAQNSSPSETETNKPKRSWFERWLYPDPPSDDQRVAPRECIPGLAAHFWTGGAPQVHGIRDISTHGLFVVTTERWYLGTRVRITLARTDDTDRRPPRSIAVEAEVIRWGNDGVGLKFILQDTQIARSADPLPFHGADRDQLKQFLKLLKSSKK